MSIKKRPYLSEHAGFKMIAFHLGVLQKLHELGILFRSEVFSAIAPSPVQANLFRVNKYYYTAFEEQMYQHLQKKALHQKIYLKFSFSKSLLFFLLLFCPGIVMLFSGYNLLPIAFFSIFLAGLFLSQLSIVSINEEIEKAYKYFFYEGSGPAPRPDLVIGFSNLQVSSFLKKNSIACGIVIRQEPINSQSSLRDEECIDLNKHPVAYVRQEDDAAQCISTFIELLEKRSLSPELISAHHLHRDWVANPKFYSHEIKDFLEDCTGYKNLAKLSIEEKFTASRLPNSYAPLSRVDLDCILRHAGVLTEIQVKLYCPWLLN